MNPANLKYKISIKSKDTFTGEDTSDNNLENTSFERQESNVTTKTVTSQIEKEVDIRSFIATVDVHGDKTSHTFSKVKAINPPL